MRTIRDLVTCVVLGLVGWLHHALVERRRLESEIDVLRGQLIRARREVAVRETELERLRVEADCAATVREPVATRWIGDASEPLADLVEVGPALRVGSEHGPLAVMYSPTGLITLVAADRTDDELVALVRWALERVRAEVAP